MTTLNFADKEIKYVEASNPNIFNPYGDENLIKLKEGQFSIFYYRKKDSYLLYLGFGYQYSVVYFEDNYYTPNKYSIVDDYFYNAYMYNIGIGKYYRFGHENRFEFQPTIGIQLIQFSQKEFKFTNFEYDEFNRVIEKFSVISTLPANTEVGLTLEPNIFYKIFYNFYLGFSFNVWLSWQNEEGYEIDRDEIYDSDGKLVFSNTAVFESKYTGASFGTRSYISVMYRF